MRLNDQSLLMNINIWIKFKYEQVYNNVKYIYTVHIYFISEFNFINF